MWDHATYPSTFWTNLYFQILVLRCLQNTYWDSFSTESHYLIITECPSYGTLDLATRDTASALELRRRDGRFARRHPFQHR